MGGWVQWVGGWVQQGRACIRQACSLHVRLPAYLLHCLPDPTPAAAPLPPAGHHGSIYALARNPFFPKFFLSIGDWTSRLWNEDLRTPIVTSSYNASYLTGGAWSPSRPGVFYTIGHGGVLETWDYYFKQREPVLSVQVSDRPLTSLALAAGAAPRTAAVGAEDGTVTLLQLSEGLVEQQDNERAVISAVGAGEWCGWVGRQASVLVGGGAAAAACLHHMRRLLC